MDPIRKIPKKFTKKFGNKVIKRQYFCRKTGLKSITQIQDPRWHKKKTKNIPISPPT